MRGCTPQTCKPCTCPASRPREEPGIGDRDINGLMDGGTYTSKAKSWSNTPLRAAGGGQDMAVIFATRGRGRVPVIGGNDIKLAYRLPGKPAERRTPHSPFDKPT